MSVKITDEEFESFCLAGARSCAALEEYIHEHGTPEEDVRLKAMFNDDEAMLAMFFVWRQGRQGV